jgi:hypothetical protein
VKALRLGNKPLLIPQIGDATRFLDEIVWLEQAADIVEMHVKRLNLLEVDNPCHFVYACHLLVTEHILRK